MPIKEFQADTIPKTRELDFHPGRKILIPTLSGNLSTSFKGRGMEFQGYRVYTPQDDASLIDWKASLRAQRLLVREYEIERNFNVFFLVDVSTSMCFSSTGKLKCEYTAELISSLAFSVLEIGSGVGFGLFTDELTTTFAPRFGKQQYYLLMKHITNPESYGGNFDFKSALKYLFTVLKERSMIIIMSDFIGLAEGWVKYMEIIANRHEVIAMMIRDPRDRRLPDEEAQYWVEDPFSNEKMLIDIDDYADAYESFVKQEEKLIRKKFELMETDFLMLSTDEDFKEPLIRFFRRRGARSR